jgi:MSHA pilin protein MshA
MKSRQTGFTLIELVMVIVLIGVLAAVAVPKFVDLGSDARAAAAAGVAGGLSSAAATNYAARKANASAAGTFAVDNCDDAGQMLQGGLPSGYTITSAAVVVDATKTDCVVMAPANAASSAFTVTGTN